MLSRYVQASGCSGGLCSEGNLMTEADSPDVPATAPADQAAQLVPSPAGTCMPIAAAPAPPAKTLASAAPTATNTLMARRFRGFLPVVIDVETGGFHAATDALLEIAAVMIEMDPDGTLRRGPTHSFHVKPFEGGRLDPAALSITGIDPHHPLRPALPERDALQRLFPDIHHAIREH